MSLHEHMPPYHYDTEDFEQLRRAYDMLYEDFEVCMTTLESATTPRKWNDDILEEMIAATGYGDFNQYLTTTEERREFLFEYLTSMRFMNEEGFIKHLDRAFGKPGQYEYYVDGVYTNGRNSTDFEPVSNTVTMRRAYVLEINNSRNVYAHVNCEGFACEFYTPKGDKTEVLAYDVLMSHIAYLYPAGFRLILDVKCTPVGAPNVIYVGSATTTNADIYGETGDIANIYKQSYLYRIMGDNEPATNNDVFRVDCEKAIPTYYVEGLWYGVDDLEGLGYVQRRQGFHVHLERADGQTGQTMDDFDIPSGIDLTKPLYLAIDGDTTLYITLVGGYADGDWRWIRDMDVDYEATGMTYDMIVNKTYIRGYDTAISSPTSRWIPSGVQFYSERYPNGFPYQIDATARKLRLTGWRLANSPICPLALYGSPTGDRSDAIVYIDSNSNITKIIPIPRFDYWRPT